MLLKSILLQASLFISIVCGSFHFPDQLRDGQSLSQKASHSLGLKSLIKVITEGQNNVFSPANIYNCLWMIYKGAKGDTKKELQNLLGDPENDKFLNELRSIQDLELLGIIFVDAVKLKLNQQFEEEFKNNIVSKDFNNNDVKSFINGIVNNATNGTIPNLLQSNVPPESLAVLVCVLYFKSSWLHQFDPKLTKMLPFNLNSKETINVPIMTLGETFPYLQENDFKIVGLPYLNNGCTLYLILPHKNGLKQLKRVMGLMTSSKFNRIKEKLVNTSIIVQVPKFSIDYNIELTPLLKGFGVNAMFDPVKADFTSMAEGVQNVYVSQVTHSVHLEIDEFGTTAAAGTAAIVAKSVPFFRATRPFGLILHHSSGHTLLYGTITKPQ